MSNIPLILICSRKSSCVSVILKIRLRPVWFSFSTSSPSGPVSYEAEKLVRQNCSYHCRANRIRACPFDSSVFTLKPRLSVVVGNALRNNGHDKVWCVSDESEINRVVLVLSVVARCRLTCQFRQTDDIDGATLAENNTHFFSVSGHYFQRNDEIWTILDTPIHRREVKCLSFSAILHFHQM